MTNKLINKSGKMARGRPRGTSRPYRSTIETVRDHIRKSIDILEDRGQPLEMLLAEEMLNGKASQVLASLSKFLPSEVNMKVEAGFVDALADVQARIDNVIDITPDNSTDNITVEDDKKDN